VTPGVDPEFKSQYCKKEKAEMIPDTSYIDFKT
jgi:hypothetical protein